MKEVFKLIFTSLLADNFYFSFFIVITIIAFVAMDRFNKDLRRELNKHHFKPDAAKKDKAYLSYCNSVVTTLITIFPLLGMLGTVTSLILVGQTASIEIDNVKSSFFTALTSTALGIVFAIIFKLIYAINQPKIEENLEELEERLAEKHEVEYEE